MKIKNQKSIRQLADKILSKNSKLRNLLSIFYPAAVIVLVIMAFFFLFFNIYSSENISLLFNKVTNYDPQATVVYLKSIRQLPFFSNELAKHKKIYGNEIENGVFNDELMEKEMINKFEQILIKNPQSRDILYGLYQLYFKAGDTKKAEEYLSKAKMIDPALK